MSQCAGGYARTTKPLLMLATVLLAGMAFQSAVAKKSATLDNPALQWVGGWASSQQLPEPHNMLSGDDVTDATIRQVVRVSAAGKRIRVVFSNAFGSAALKIDAAHVAISDDVASSRIKVDSGRAIKFSGNNEIIIPAGAEYVSDPIDMPVAAFTSLTISFHVPGTIEQQTGHPGSRATSYIAHGNRVAEVELADAKKIDHWYQLSAVHVEADRRAAAIVTLGDSITDGRGSTTNGNNRWPDFLAERLQASPKTRHVSVLNHGVGGNRLLNDGLGPNAVARFDRDVIAQAGVKWVVVLEGINDIGTLTSAGLVSNDKHAELVKRVIGAYEQVIARAHVHGIKVIGATILPYGGSQSYKPDPMSEADRVAINEWIRTPGHFDAVVDFDRAMRDPNRSDRLLSDYDSGDGLHPSPKGFKAMAEAFPLALFE